MYKGGRHVDEAKVCAPLRLKFCDVFSVIITLDDYLFDFYYNTSYFYRWSILRYILRINLVIHSDDWKFKQ